MKRVFTIAILCLSMYTFTQEKEYKINKNDLMVLKYPNKIEVHTPQGVFTSNYLNITLIDDEIVSFNGKKSTVWWSENWISITYSNGVVKIWRW